MTWLRGVKPLPPGCATECVLKNLECVLKKTKTAGLLKKCFYVLFKVIITNKVPVPVTIL